MAIPSLWKFAHLYMRGRCRKAHGFIAWQHIEEMMVGDMCNAIVGRFKGCMEQNGTHLKMTWPMTATGYPMGLSVSTGRPALVQKLFTHDELYVELYLDQIQEKAVKYNYTSRQVNFGELNFL